MSKSYISSSLTFYSDKIIVSSSGYEVMMDWEHPIMSASAAYVTQNGGDILEIGFGTGLNALLTAQKAKQKNILVNYHGIELYPVRKESYRQLNFTDLIGLEQENLLNLHNCTWEEKHKISDYFSITKNNVSLEKYKTTVKFDIIYFDAFSPEKQAELWTDIIFKKMFCLLKDDGFLVTYCAKGVVRRTLKAVGFEVISLDGPPGKRQMTRANRK